MSEEIAAPFVVTVKEETLRKLFEGFSKVFLTLLMTLTFAILTAGTVRMTLDFVAQWKVSLLAGLQVVIVDSLTLLAMFEIYLTLLTYFKEYRVKVTYVIDSVFIMMLSEVIKQWYSHELSVQSVMMLVFLLVALTAIRFFSVRYSPSKENGGKKS
ncbi:MAG: phosphate-starvation-inducible PsiE family protein [Bacteroidota bacterium]